MGDLPRWTLAGLAAALIVATVATVRPPGRRISVSTEPMPDLEAHRQRWSELHGGFEVASNSFVRRWLGAVHVMARIPATWGMSSNLLSLWGIWCAGACAEAGALGGPWPLVGAVLVIANGVFDGLDGAVAVLRRRVSHYGRLIDTVADRASDGLFLVALIALGASVWTAWGTGVVIFGLELTRAAILRQGRVGRLTPGERPTRLILVGLGMLVAGAWPDQADTAGAIALELTALLVLISWLLLLTDLRGSRSR